MSEYADIPDADWFGILNDLVSDGLVDAKFVRTGVDEVIRGVYNIDITSRGRAFTPEQARVHSMPTKDGGPLKSVTRKGECFEIVFERKEMVHNRDGVFYLFRVNALSDKK